MSYTLVLVGGTGQRFGLGLAYLNLLGIAVMPDRVVVVDAEGVNAQNPVSTSLRRLLTFGHPEMSFKAVLPYPGNGESDFTVAQCIEVGGSELFPLCYTSDEAGTKIGEGFYAQPKLAALVFRGLLERSPTAFHDEVKQGTATASTQRRVFVVGSVAGGTGAGILRELAHTYRRAQNQVFGVVFPRFFDVPDGSPTTDDLDRNARLGCDYLLRRDLHSPFDVLAIVGPPHGASLGPPVKSDQGRPHDFCGLAAALSLVTDGGDALSARYEAERTNQTRKEGDPFRLDLTFAARKDQEPLHDTDVRFPTRDGRGRGRQISLADACDAAAEARACLTSWGRFPFTQAYAGPSLFVERKLGAHVTRTLRDLSSTGRHISRAQANQLWEKLTGEQGALSTAIHGLQTFTDWTTGIAAAQSMRQRKARSTEITARAWRDALGDLGGPTPRIDLGALAQKWCIAVARAQWKASDHGVEGGGGRWLFPYLKTGATGAPGELVKLGRVEIPVEQVDSRSFPSPFGQALAFAKKIELRDEAARVDAETLWLALAAGWLAIELRDLSSSHHEFERLAVAIDEHARFTGLLRVRAGVGLPTGLKPLAGKLVGATHASCGLWPGVRGEVGQSLKQLHAELAQGTHRATGRRVLRRWKESLGDRVGTQGAAWARVVRDLTEADDGRPIEWEDVRTRGPVLLETGPGKTEPFYLFSFEPNRAETRAAMLRILAAGAPLDSEHITVGGRDVARLQRRHVYDGHRFDPQATIRAGYLDLDHEPLDLAAFGAPAGQDADLRATLSDKMSVPGELLAAWNGGAPAEPSPRQPDLTWRRSRGRTATEPPPVVRIDVRPVEAPLKVDEPPERQPSLVRLTSVYDHAPDVPDIAFHPGRRAWVVWLYDVSSNSRGLCHLVEGTVVRVERGGRTWLLHFPADSVIMKPQEIFSPEGFKFASKHGPVLPALPIKDGCLDLVECDDALSAAATRHDALGFTFRVFGGLELTWAIPPSNLAEEVGVNIELWPNLPHRAWRRFWLAIEANKMPDAARVFVVYRRSRFGYYEEQRRFGGLKDPHAGSRYVSVDGRPRLLWVGSGGKGAGFLLFPDEGVDGGAGSDGTIAVDFGTFSTTLLVAVPSRQQGMPWPAAGTRLPAHRRKIVETSDDRVNIAHENSLFPPTDDRGSAAPMVGGTIATVLNSSVVFSGRALPGAGSIPFQDFGIPLVRSALSEFKGDLKWSTDPRTAEVRVGYLKAVLLLGAVEAFSRGATRLGIRYSFPLAYDNPEQLDDAFKAATRWLTGYVNAANEQVPGVITTRPGQVDVTMVACDSESNAGMKAAGARDQWVVTLDLGGGTLDLGLFQGRDQPEPVAWDSVKLGGNLVLSAHREPDNLRWKMRLDQFDYKDEELVPHTDRLMRLALEYAARVVAGALRHDRPTVPASVTALLLGSGWRLHCCLTGRKKFDGAGFAKHYGSVLEARLAELAGLRGAKVAINAGLLDDSQEKLAVAYGLACIVPDVNHGDTRVSIRAPNGLDESEHVRWTTMIADGDKVGAPLGLLADPPFPPELERIASFNQRLAQPAVRQYVETRVKNVTSTTTSFRKRTAVGLAYESFVDAWFKRPEKAQEEDR